MRRSRANNGIRPCVVAVSVSEWMVAASLSEWIVRVHSLTLAATMRFHPRRNKLRGIEPKRMSPALRSFDATRNECCRYAALAFVVGLLAAVLVPAAEPRTVPSGEDPFAAALALQQQRRYPEARAALEAFVARNPNHAAACHALGLIWKLRHDNEAYEEAVKWLRRAAELEPQNPRYLADYGGTSLELASRTRSPGAATRGRDAMEKALAIDPADIDARRGLYEFYRQAPWPLGSSAKAAAHLAEIRKRDPATALVLDINARAAAKDFAGAFKLCNDVLAREPDNYDALYYFGRTASISGENLEPGLAALRKCLTLRPPSPASPTHRNVWNRIALVLDKLGRAEEAQAARDAIRKLDAARP